MTSVLKNDAATTLAVALSSSDLTMTVADGSVFPTLSPGQWFNATIQSQSNLKEIVKVTSVSGNVLTMTRGQENTIPIPFQIGARVEIRVTVQNIYDLIEELTGDYLIL